ncbi:MAG TPA: GAF domain-containing sensor histidine kinase [Rubrobacter sp.]|nr:GAF domain-containing sensor histidine kinase [Rubrobacter sp.]
MSPRAAARLAWSLWVACVALLALALLLDFLHTEDILSYPWQIRINHMFLYPMYTVVTGMLSLVYPTIGALIVSRLPTNPIGWIFCGVGLLYQIQHFTLAYSNYALAEKYALPWGEYVGWFSMWIGFAGLILAGIFLMLLFPDGRLLSRRWRIVMWAAVLGATLAALSDGFYPGRLATHGYAENPFGAMGVFGGWLTAHASLPVSKLLASALLLVSTLAALFSPLVRLRRASGDARQQLKWFLYAAVPVAVCLSAFLVEVMISNYAMILMFQTWGTLDINVGNRSYNLFHVSSYVPAFALLLLAVFTCVAILRYRLYDIDRLINRTLVYGSLSACIVGTYMLAVVGLGVLFQARGNPAISLVATVVAALLIQPLRSRLQRGINRLLYGERDDPSAVTSRLGSRLEATLAPEAVLPTVVETIAQALKLPYAAILLKEGEGFRSGASYGSPTTEPETLPLVYQREEIGRLVIAPRAPGEGFSDADRRLLEDLARQAEIAVHAVRLTADLQRSRERLVTTREEERRRLRRDLHDGLGPTLASFALKLEGARKLVRRKPEDAEVLLSSLMEQTQATVMDVRRLVYGLRPPALDDLGLVAAIRQQAESYGFVAHEGFSGAGGDGVSGETGLVFSLEAPGNMPTLPAAVEVACYRIAQEAITNVARHAYAKTCRVRLSVDREAGVLEVEITDDGAGMPEERVAGVGLSSMRERAEELGGILTVEPGSQGGTRVLARLSLLAQKEHAEGATSSWSAPSASS